MYFSVLNFEYESVLVSGKDNEDLFWKLGQEIISFLQLYY
jgi:hypothetical protein